MNELVSGTSKYEICSTSHLIRRVLLYFVFDLFLGFLHLFLLHIGLGDKPEASAVQ